MFAVSTHRSLSWLLVTVASLSAPCALAEQPAPDANPKVLVVPAAYVGEVRAIYEKKIQKGLSDAFAASNRLDVLTDKDRAEKPAVAKDKTAQVKSTVQSRQIDEADLKRQEGTDLAAEGKHKEALGKFRAAITQYEQSASELVDFTKLADAYARAGLAASATGATMAEVTRLFEAGVTIQPTLVIDRRKQSKELLAAFDAAHDRVENGKRAVIHVEGEAAGADVFVDGVKVGPLPAHSEPLPVGTHHVQVRGGDWQPWYKSLNLRAKDSTISAKLVEVKKEKAARKDVELGIDALEDCAKAGAFGSDKCRIPGQKLGKQTGASYLVFCAVKADRYGRLQLHPFLAESATGATVALKPIDLAADLADLNARAAKFEADVADTAANFPKARALTHTPSVYSSK